MEYNEEDNGAAGRIPEFGAIFMSNVLTKKECFKRKIFALPFSKAEFVKHIKAGMVLFLFEFEKRKLFGVYQASSDGAMDIVPHAFNYSGRRFPAQVCFKPIWYCDPLSEKEFREAIRENYYSAKKFNFGLSEDQVRRLLSLFSTRKLKNRMPPHLLAGRDVGVSGKDGGMVGDDGFALRERGYMQSTDIDEFNPAVFCDYQVKSLAGAREDEALLDDGDGIPGEVYPLAQGNFLAKRRRMDNDERLIMTDVAENAYIHGTLRTFNLDSPQDSLDELRRLTDARLLARIQSLRSENQVDRSFNTVLSSEYMMGSLDVRTAAVDMFMHGNRLFGENNMENGSGMAFENECYGKPLDRSKHAIDEDRVLFDGCVQREEHNVCDIDKPMVYSDGNLTLHRQAREMRDDHQWLMNRKLENRYHSDCDGSPVRAFECSAGHLDEVRKRTPGGTFAVNERIESEPNFDNCSMDGFSSKNSSRPLHCGQRIIHDRQYPIVEGRVTENMDGILCSAALTRNAGYIGSVDGRVGNDGKLRKSEPVDNEENIHELPVISMEYPTFSKQKQSFSSFPDKLVPEKRLSQLTVAHNFDRSHSTFDDATITRAVPYIPENSNSFHGYPASRAANQSLSSVLENHPHDESLANFYSLSANRLSPYLLDSKKSSRFLDMAPEFGNKILLTNTSDHQTSLLHEAGYSFQNSNLPMQMNLNAPSVHDRGSLCPKLSLTSLPSTDRQNIEGEKRVFAYPIKSSENRFAFDGNLSTASQHVSEHVREINTLAGKNFICSDTKDSSVGVHNPEGFLASYGNQYYGVSSCMNAKEHHEISGAPHFNSNVNRRSVFSRLTSRQESQVGEERNGSDFDSHGGYMDATADEVMKMLQQGNNLPLRKPAKLRVVRQQSVDNEKQSQSPLETNQSTMEKKKLNNAHIAVQESIDEVPKETRIVDFKRRSDTKKNLDGTNIDSAADNNRITGISEEVESSTKRTLKRKKLIRPVFSEIESSTDAICSNQNLHLPGQILDEDGKRSHERTISNCEAEMPNDENSLSNVLASHAPQSMECNLKEH